MEKMQMRERLEDPRNLSAYEGEVVLVCDCGERFYNAQDFFDDHRFINLCHVVIKGAVYEN